MSRDRTRGLAGVGLACTPGRDRTRRARGRCAREASDMAVTVREAAGRLVGEVAHVVGGKPRGAEEVVPDPFIVIATQNPIELEGTFPLPEAQLDRFLFLVNLGYPDAADEDAILKLHGPATVQPEALRPILDAAAVATLRAEVRAVRVGDAVRGYVAALVRATRALA